MLVPMTLLFFLWADTQEGIPVCHPFRQKGGMTWSQVTLLWQDLVTLLWQDLVSCGGKLEAASSLLSAICCDIASAICCYIASDQRLMPSM